MSARARKFDARAAARTASRRLTVAAGRAVPDLAAAVEAAGGVAGLLDMARRASSRFNGHREVAVLEALARWAEARRGT